jgi:tripartite-type tricarboxylate transporter receptor subunit TctC
MTGTVSKLFASLAGAVAASALSVTTGFAQTNFENKTIRFVIASTPSGPTDLMGRAFAQPIARHVPGNPAVVVENRPGAVGVVAANYIYNVAQPDGLTVGVLLGMVTSGVMKIAGVQYNPSNFPIVGAVSATQVLLARHDLKMKDPKDLLNPAQPLVLASLGSSSTTDAANRLFLDMIGAKYRYVTGYPGQAEAILAVARGEANLANASHNTYLSRRESILKEGAYDAFLQRGELTAGGVFKRNAQLSHVPTMVEAIEQIRPEALQSADFAAYKSVVGSMALHYSFVLPPKTPPDVVETLRKAFAQALDDKGTRDTVRKMIHSDYEYVAGQEANDLVRDLEKSYNSDPRIGQRLKEIMAVK